MKRQSRNGLAKPVLLVSTAAALLFLSPAVREHVVTTARAAAQRVLVINKDNRPVSVRQARELFQLRLQIGIADSSRSAFDSFQVPNGMRLVIENLGGKGAAQGINYVEASQDGGSAFLRPVSVNLPGSWQWIGTTPTKVIFNAGNVSVSIQRPSAQGGCTTCTRSNSITLTGYLIPD